MQEQQQQQYVDDAEVEYEMGGAVDYENVNNNISVAHGSYFAGASTPNSPVMKDRKILAPKTTPGRKCRYGSLDSSHVAAISKAFSEVGGTPVGVSESDSRLRSVEFIEHYLQIPVRGEVTPPAAASGRNRRKYFDSFSDSTMLDSLGGGLGDGFAPATPILHHYLLTAAPISETVPEEPASPSGASTSTGSDEICEGMNAMSTSTVPTSSSVEDNPLVF